MADSETLRKLRRQHRSLVQKIGQIGPILKGSVSASYTRCGKPNCRCQGDPTKLHGPYWQWSTSVHGKTVARRLNDQQRDLYQHWIDNRKHLEDIIAEMHLLALDAAAADKTNA